MTTDATGTAPATGDLHSQESIVSAFDSLLSLPEDKQEGAEATEATETPEPITEAEGAEGASQEGEATEEQSEEAAPEAEGQEETQEPAADHKFTVRIDGKDEAVPLSELLAGYSRQSDYTRKTQALATERKTFEQEHGSVRQERAEYANLLPKLRAALEGGMGSEPNWDALRKEDPTKFAAEWASWQQRKSQVDAVKAEEARVRGKQDEDFAAARNKILTDEREALLKAMPSWKDKAVASKESDAIAQALKDVGFKDHELALYDHRALLIAWKASKYDAIQKAKPDLQKKAAAARVVKPGGGSVKPRTATDKARSRFNTSGSVKDLAGLLEQML